MRLAWLFLLFSISSFAHEAQFGWEPRQDARVPADALFREGRLGDYLGRAPLVLVLGYGDCLHLCSTTRVGVAEALSRTGLSPGRDYRALFVSIDPRDERAPPPPMPGWTVLTGAKAAGAVANAVGFRYAREASSGEFAHPAGFVVLTPEGKVARTFGGVRFDAGELRAALVDAGGGAASGGFVGALLRCFHDPVSGRYTAAALTAVRVAAALFLAALALLAWRRLR